MIRVGGLKKVCDYWWRQWRQGDVSLAKDVRSCHRILLQDRLGERCRALTRTWSLEPENSREDPAFPSKVERVEESDCEPAQWEAFLGGIRGVIGELERLPTPADTDDASLSTYLIQLEELRKAHVTSFRPYLQAIRPVQDALALAYYYGRFHEALFESLMRLDDPSLGSSESALWRRKLSQRGEPLKSIALSAYQKALSLRTTKDIHVLEPALQEALLRLEALSSQPALDYLPFPGEGGSSEERCLKCRWTSNLYGLYKRVGDRRSEGKGRTCIASGFGRSCGGRGTLGGSLSEGNTN